MRSYTVIIDGEEFAIGIGDDHAVSLDGAPVQVDVRRIDVGRFSLLLEGKSLTFAITGGNGRYGVTSAARSYEVVVENERQRLLKKLGTVGTTRSVHQEVRAPMPALVVRVEVSPGDTVREGGGLVVLEAMKMENELKSPVQGRVKEVHVAAGRAVEKGELLITLE